MYKIVLLRHGESTWNQENRFTGWTDVDLTERDVAEAHRAGQLLKAKGFVFDKAYASVLTRANRTQNLVLEELDADLRPIRGYYLADESTTRAAEAEAEAEVAAQAARKSLSRFSTDLRSAQG